MEEKKEEGKKDIPVIEKIEEKKEEKKDIPVVKKTKKKKNILDFVFGGLILVCFSTIMTTLLILFLLFGEKGPLRRYIDTFKSGEKKDSYELVVTER